MAFYLLRGSDYGKWLRIAKPAPYGLGPGGLGKFEGTSVFDELYVRNLFVTENLFSYDTDIDLSSTSATRFGTTDPQDLRIKTNNLDRLQIVSAGVAFFTSALPAAAFLVTSVSEDFNRANESPVTGWTQVSAGMLFRVSANALHTSGEGATGNLRSLYFDTSPYQANTTVQADLAGMGTSGVNSDRVWVIGRLTSAAGQQSYGAGYDVGLSAVRIDTISAGKFVAANLANGPTVTPISAGMVRLTLSATSALAYLDGIFQTWAAVSSYAGFAGVSKSEIGTPLVSWDNFNVLGAGTWPMSAGDTVWQSSARLWCLLGTDQINNWAQLYHGETQLGLNQSVTFTGAISCTVSAGTSAFFPATTFGVVRLLSAVGTTGLSGVVGLSGVGVTVSAVGNDIAISGALSPTTLWGFRGLSGGNLGGTSASANLYWNADYFALRDSSHRAFVGTSLAVSCDITVASAANGRDITASFPAPSWVYFYAISGANGVASIASSAVPSAGPVLPSGYTAWGLLDARYLQSTSALREGWLAGHEFSYSSAFGAAQILTGGAAETATAVQASAFVPPIAPAWWILPTGLWTASSTETGSMSFNLRVSAGINLVTISLPTIEVDATRKTSFNNTYLLLPNIGQSVSYLWAGTLSGSRALYLDVMGYRIPNGAV